MLTSCQFARLFYYRKGNNNNHNNNNQLTMKHIIVLLLDVSVMKIIIITETDPHCFVSKTGISEQEMHTSSA
jgi:hypothetical protein